MGEPAPLHQLQRRPPLRLPPLTSPHIMALAALCRARCRTRDTAGLRGADAPPPHETAAGSRGLLM